MQDPFPDFPSRQNEFEGHSGHFCVQAGPKNCGKHSVEEQWKMESEGMIDQSCEGFRHSKKRERG
jgi:hypothetical protein